jgi:hypothetical protein
MTEQTTIEIRDTDERLGPTDWRGYDGRDQQSIWDGDEESPRTLQWRRAA